MKLLNKQWASKIAAAALAFSVADTLYAQAGETPAARDDIIAPPRLVTTRDVVVDPLVPVGVIAGLGLLYGATCLLAAHRKVKGAWLRASAGGIAAIALINPEIRKEERAFLPTDVAIVVDRSASQSLDDREAVTSTAYENLVKALEAAGGINIRTMESTKGENATPLFAALETGMAGRQENHLGGVIMITDGQVHDKPGKTSLSAPLHALITGHEKEHDRRLVIDELPRFGQVGKEQVIKFHVSDDGVSQKPEKPVTVTVKNDGQDVATLSVMPGSPAEAVVKIANRGENMIEIEAAPLDGELTPLNNRAAAAIEGTRESMNVLLVSGLPTQGTRLWRDLLKTNPDNNVVHFTILRFPHQQNRVPLSKVSLVPIPTDELFVEKIGKFDLIILDHFENRDILPDAYLANIAQRVKDGGALLVVAGPEYAGKASLYKTALGAILPAAPDGTVSEKPYTPQISADGKRHPVTRGLDQAEEESPPWGRWLRLTGAGAPKAGSRTVMEGTDKKPLLILNRVEKGRVAVLHSDQAWLWARGFEGGGPYAEIVKRVTGWLAQEPALEEESLRIVRADDKLVIEQQTMASDSHQVTITSPSGKITHIKPEAGESGLWRTTIAADEAGLYRAAQEGKNPATAFVNIGTGSSREFAATLSTEKRLAPFAEATGGTIARLDKDGKNPAIPLLHTISAARAAKEQSPKGALRIVMNDASVLKGIERLPLMPPALAFVLAIGALAAAYIREGDKPLFSRKHKNPSPDGPAA